MMRVNRRIAVLALLLASGFSSLSDEIVRLEDLDIHSFRAVRHAERPRAKKCCERETPLRMNGGVWENGLGMKADSAPIDGEFFPAGKAKRFEVTFGLDEAANRKATAVLNVYGDERLLATSGEAKYGEPAKELKADLAGVNVVRIELTDAGCPSSAAYADLAEAKFVMEDGAKPLDDPSLFSLQLGILTPKGDGAPRVNGPELYGARPGKALLYRVPVSGEKPLEVTVDGLPDGTHFDAATSMIRGKAPAKKGEYPLVIRAKNARGSVEKVFTLVVGDRISLTPPMGWNSWNCFAPNVTDERVRAQAEAMLRLGLAEHGWQYLVIDDFWERNEERGKKPENAHLSGPRRDAGGNVLLNARFPDMKALTDHIHALGLKAGIYSSPGPTTCGGCEGSWRNEWRDAAQYAKWGFDYLKYDWCSAGSVKFGEERLWKMLPWLMMGKALKEQDRDIYYSLSIGSLDIPYYGPECYANSWRITGDVFNSWPHIRRSMAAERYCWYFTKPGEWCDPDMLVLQTNGPKRGHRLTPNEQYTHISMWCLFAAPLMIGNDMTQMNEFTLSLLTNDEVLEVNQDRLGLCAALVQKPNGGKDEVWAKPMADGSVAAGILNLSYAPRKVKMCFKALGMRGKWRVRDLWRQKDEGLFEDCYETEIPGHATQLVRIWPTEGAHFDKNVQDIRDFAWMREVEQYRPLKPGADGCEGCGDRKARIRDASKEKSAASAEDLARPVRPGGVNGAPFWNGRARMFLYAPAFDFPKSDRAVKYRFEVSDAKTCRLAFEADSPTAPLSPVWDRIATGFVTVWCLGVDGDGKTFRLTGSAERDSRTFWKSAPFRSGSYPKAPRGYGEASARCAAHLFGRKAFQTLMETGRPDMKGLTVNCYPSKVHAAVVEAMLDYAKRCPRQAGESLRLARAAADYLISVSQPKGAPLEYFTPTYEGQALMAGKRQGLNMVIYPADAGMAFLRLSRQTNERRYLEAAERIAGTYLRLQEADGTWSLLMRESDGAVVWKDRVQPIGIIRFLEELALATGKDAYRVSADRAFEWIKTHAVGEWDWAGQFEDMGGSSPKYANPSEHAVVDTALYALERYPNDPKWVDFARDAMRFAEDQFVCWERPSEPSGKGVTSLRHPPSFFANGYGNWTVPCTLEQYGYYVPVDASSAKMIMGYLALYKVAGDALYLEKARALGDTLVRLQKPNGYIPTEFWQPRHYADDDGGWPNCTSLTIRALSQLAEFDPPERR